MTLSNPLGTGFILIWIGFFRYREEKDLFLFWHIINPRAWHLFHYVNNIGCSQLQSQSKIEFLMAFSSFWSVLCYVWFAWHYRYYDNKFMEPCFRWNLWSPRYRERTEETKLGVVVSSCSMLAFSFNQSSLSCDESFESKLSIDILMRLVTLHTFNDIWQSTNDHALIWCMICKWTDSLCFLWDQCQISCTLWWTILL